MHMFIHQIESVLLMLEERLTLLENEVRSNKVNMEDNETNFTTKGYNGVSETHKENQTKQANRKRRK